MNEIYYLDKNAKHEIQTLFKSSRLIPFFGSGFTKGMQAKRGRVPDAKGLTEVIKSLAKTKFDSVDRQNEIDSIKNLKTAFGLLDFIDEISRKEKQSLLSSVFSNVKVNDKSKSNLLNLDWPHIFTFNIDDAIENTINQRYKILPPNRKTSREYISSNKCLFKIHGDISEYISHDDASLIFTWREYVSSIKSNQPILNFMKDEANDSSFLFIGCSMDAELDLIHLSQEIPFKKSIYLKKGPLSLEEKISLRDYHIEKVIYFDDYDQISPWIYESLVNIERKAPIREISFDDSILAREDAIKVIMNGGPIYKTTNDQRIAIASTTFPTRTIIKSAIDSLRVNQYLLITGKRISGKTLFIFQMLMSLKEFGVTYFSSTDQYTPIIRKRLEGLDNHIFVFDSNSLTYDSLHEVCFAKIKPSSKVIICASAGDAEQFRFTLNEKFADRELNYKEIMLSNRLSKVETEQLNMNMNIAALPMYKNNETLLNYAYRCYDEYKTQFKHESLFDKSYSDDTLLILIVIAACEKASINHIKAILNYFNIDEFLRENDRLFELEKTPNGEEVLICNSSSWLIKKVSVIINRSQNAADLVSRVIRSLEENGFTSLATNLFRFDKLNELSGNNNSEKFIKDVYVKIADIYSNDSHYWLQRAKTELISGKILIDIENGISYARKVRIDNSSVKGKTYYSATLVLTQLQARAFILSRNRNDEYLLNFIDSCHESIVNYQNNKRHVDDMVKSSDVEETLDYIRENPTASTLPKKNKLDELLMFFSYA